MNIEADAFALEGIDQFRGKTWEINPESLNTIIEFRINGFNDGISAIVVNIDGGDPTGLAASRKRP